MVSVIISGICGRMGKRIAGLAMDDADVKIVGSVEAASSGSLGKDIGEILGIAKAGIKIEKDLGSVIKHGDCVIEFTTPEATSEHIEIARKNKKAMVIGTTGLSDDQIRTISKAAKTIPIVFSPNMSVGVNLLFKLVRDAANALGKDYAVNIEEAHHAHKKDAPSGTAKKLGEIIKSNKKDGIENVDIKSIREGEIVGDHKIIFTGEFEALELSHSAKSRDVFAQGAILAAKFIVNKKHGLYAMADVLSLKD